MASETRKTAIVYLISIGLLSYYGIEVCPFLESMTTRQLLSVHAGAFLIGFVCRSLLVFRLQRQEESRDEIDMDRPWRYLQVDLGTWICIGLLVTAWNSLAYSFPVGSGLKVVLGCATLGVFSATSLALDVEHRLIGCLSQDASMASSSHGRFLSITTKFLVFIGLCVGVICLVLLLLIYKDFQFVVERLTTTEPFQFAWIVREVVFVFAVLLAGTAVVLSKYRRNLQLMFDLQLDALRVVGEGNYDSLVPVVSHDEFSSIAEQTNDMIAGLKERERVKAIFGKYMSAPVAREILDSEHGDDLGGREIRVAVLFTDLRDFTPLSEKSSPREVVQILNEYFTLVVETVHRHHGVLDKFIGDAAMAIFGLGGGGHPCDDALASAVDIRRGLTAMNTSLGERGLATIDTGAGIDYGQVVAGNIGSRERMEFTVIGDTVNTASRLEALTKELPVSVALSETVYGELAEQARADLEPMGDHALKGKVAPLPVLGLAAQ